MALTASDPGKRDRRDSSDEFYIEELSPDDMGYDGDVEVIRPDHYEEADSDFEDDKTTRPQWPDTDEELARKLRRLACDADIHGSPHRDGNERGQKRRSKEMETDTPHGQGGRSTEIEVSEVVEADDDQHPNKRRKKRPGQTMAHRLGRRRMNGAWSDSSERTDERETVPLIESSCSGTPEVTPAPENATDNDAMDIE